MPYLIGLVLILGILGIIFSFIDSSLILVTNKVHSLFPITIRYILGIIFIALSIVCFFKSIYYKVSSKNKGLANLALEKEEKKSLLKELKDNIRTNNDHHYSNEEWAFKKDTLVNNHPLPLPNVIKKIRLITGKGAATYYDFDTTLAIGTKNVIMRSNIDMAESDLCENTDSIINKIQMIINMENSSQNPADVICIIRGGGNNTSLNKVFDNSKLYSIFKESNIPILTAIGHATNLFLCDKCSDSPMINNEKKYFVTPTDLAHFLNEHNNLKIKEIEDFLSVNDKITTPEIKIKQLVIGSIIIILLYNIFIH